jgi:hypothetical protein
MMDKDFILFGSKMLNFVRRRYDASCDSREAELFVQQVYEQWHAQGP